MTDIVSTINKGGDSQLLLYARNDVISEFETAVRGSLTERYGDRLGETLLAHTNKYGKNVVHEAAQNHSIRVLRFVLRELHLNVDTIKQGDWTPLMLALAAPQNCHCSSDCTIGLLLECGASIQLRNRDGWTAFHVAVRANHVRHVQRLLAQDPECWSTRSKNGRTPLHTVALDGCHDVIGVLLGSSCSYPIDERDSCGSTAFMDSVRANDVVIARLLYAEGHGHDRGSVDRSGMDCVHIAASLGHVQILEYLHSELGYPLATRTRVHDLTAAQLAARGGRLNVLQYLGEHAKETLTSIAESSKRTPMEVAEMHKKMECVEVLREFIE